MSHSFWEYSLVHVLWQSGPHPTALRLSAADAARPAMGRNHRGAELRMAYVGATRVR